ncbi:MAG: hydrogenase formation protein HypD [Spirochaetia bacterium]
MLKYLDEFRSDKVAAYYIKQINEHMPSFPVALMEICGGHTLTIVKYGLQALLPEGLRLISGPGCPVCVTPQGYIDAAIELSRQPDMIITSFGDMLRVPGSTSSLYKEKATGADIRVCLSSLDALEIAAVNPRKQVVFLGIGFETTAPTVAYAVKAAARDGVKNFSVLSALKTIPNAMQVLLTGGELNLQGFICPGHVSAITGTDMYEKIVQDFKVPCVVSGFEPTDMLEAVGMTVAQLKDGRAEVDNQYKRSVKGPGNRHALEVIDEIFVSADTEWRGLGVIPGSGLSIREAFAAHDAARKFPLTLQPAREHPGCICGAVMRGVKLPTDCGLFGTVCTPYNPVGACMVSAEGSCGIYYKYAKK